MNTNIHYKIGKQILVDEAVRKMKSYLINRVGYEEEQIGAQLEESEDEFIRLVDRAFELGWHARALERVDSELDYLDYLDDWDELKPS